MSHCRGLLFLRPNDLWCFFVLSLLGQPIAGGSKPTPLRNNKRLGAVDSFAVEDFFLVNLPSVFFFLFVSFCLGSFFGGVPLLQLSPDTTDGIPVE